jgi:hypothetical protein
MEPFLSFRSSQLGKECDCDSRVMGKFMRMSDASHDPDFVTAPFLVPDHRSMEGLCIVTREMSRYCFDNSHGWMDGRALVTLSSSLQLPVRCLPCLALPCLPTRGISTV